MMSSPRSRWLYGVSALAVLLVVTVLATACTGQREESRTADDVAEAPTDAGTAEENAPLPEYIGTATMTEDRVITLRLRAEGAGGAVGHGMLTYAPDHAEYQHILEHLGGLEPGEERPVRPFPDDEPSE